MSSLSIITTVYNDAEIVPFLVDNIIKNIPTSIDKYEIILVNDHSTDNSELAILKECDKNLNIKGIALSRNFGQQIAMSAGMHYCSGDIVVIMDGDMQNPPSVIPELLNKLNEGYDIVYTVSKRRNDIMDSFTSFIFWFILLKIFKVKIVKHQLMMKIMTKDFVEKFRKYAELNRTVGGIVNDISSNYAVLEIQNQKRSLGRSNYTFTKRLNLMIDMIISLSSAPLNFMIYIGFFTFLLSIAGLIYYLISYIFYDVPQGYTSVLLSIFFFGGITTIILGIIGRYLANIYSEVRQRPLFNIKKTFNL